MQIRMRWLVENKILLATGEGDATLAAYQAMSQDIAEMPNAQLRGVSLVMVMNHPYTLQLSHIVSVVAGLSQVAPLEQVVVVADNPLVRAALRSVDTLTYLPTIETAMHFLMDSYTTASTY